MSNDIKRCTYPACPEGSCCADPSRAERESTLHQVKHEDVIRLMNIFAYLTPEGWVVPEWLDLMGRTIRIGARS